jgi:hypothetical protein
MTIFGHAIPYFSRQGSRPASSTGSAQRAGGRPRAAATYRASPQSARVIGVFAISMQLSGRNERRTWQKAKPGLPNEGGGPGKGCHERYCAARQTRSLARCRVHGPPLFRARPPGFEGRAHERCPATAAFRQGHGTALPHADVITREGLPWCMFRAESRPGET